MRSPHIIFDPLYGLIHLNEVEWEIVQSTFFQRLRWIKQLGFSHYVFPGAEHSRFGHSIGCLNNAHCILQSLRMAVSQEELMDSKCITAEAVFHKSIRLAALLHDLGTFPFSHTVEEAYIIQGENNNKNKTPPDNHEHLASYIIKNTDYPGGITYILKKYGLEPQEISDLVKGVSPSILANQILHSEVDCDRMDYLLRDAHYTGLKYGTYDREYLLHHFKKVTVAGKDILAINDNALHCVEDFLMARFAWYSQVIRSSRGAKYDAVAMELAWHLLQKKKIPSYQDLLQMIVEKPVEFYGFNDNYFMQKVHELYVAGEWDKNPKLKDWAEIVLFQRPVYSVRCEELQQRIVGQDDEGNASRIVKRAQEKMQELKRILEKRKDPHDWLLVDFPRKDIVFVKSYKQVIKHKDHQNILLERDPAKICFDNGEVKLLAEVDRSIISKLQNTSHFIPNIFCSLTTLRYFQEQGLCS